jgi:hypothetical protein
VAGYGADLNTAEFSKSLMLKLKLRGIVAAEGLLE